MLTLACALAMMPMVSPLKVAAPIQGNASDVAMHTGTDGVGLNASELTIIDGIVMYKSQGKSKPLIDMISSMRCELCAHRMEDARTYQKCYGFMVGHCNPGPDGIMDGSPGERTTGHHWCIDFFNRECNSAHTHRCTRIKAEEERVAKAAEVATEAAEEIAAAPSGAPGSAPGSAPGGAPANPPATAAPATVAPSGAPGPAPGSTPGSAFGSAVKPEWYEPAAEPHHPPHTAKHHRTIHKMLNINAAGRLMKKKGPIDAEDECRQVCGDGQIGATSPSSECVVPCQNAVYRCLDHHQWEELKDERYVLCRREVLLKFDAVDTMLRHDDGIHSNWFDSVDQGCCHDLYADHTCCHLL